MTAERQKCAAIGCPEAVRLRALMCRTHWWMVPESIRADLWRAYVPGQERGIHIVPSDRYRALARAAIAAVCRIEHGGSRAAGDTADAPGAP